MQFYTEASDIQIWRTVDNSSDFSENKYSTTKVYQLTIATLATDISGVAGRNKLTSVEVKYHVIQGLTVVTI